MESINAVVTGGTKGIGLAICRHFAAAGYHLVTCSRHARDLESLQKELGAYKVQIRTFEADLSEQNQLENFADYVLGGWNHIDILVNNAGIFIPGSVLSEEEGHQDEMMRTNLHSAYYLCRKLVPIMLEKRKGHIFNICSIASIIAYPNGGSYSISKFALLGFTKVLREELKDKGIKVTAVLPGATWSDSWTGVDLLESRLMQADDIASSVINAFQMSPAAVVEEIILRPQLGDL